MKPTRTLRGDLSNEEFLTSASTARARRSNATMFEQNKRTFLSTLPRNGFNAEVCSSFSLSQLDCKPSQEDLTPDVDRLTM